MRHACITPEQLAVEEHKRHCLKWFSEAQEIAADVGLVISVETSAIYITGSDKKPDFIAQSFSTIECALAFLQGYESNGSAGGDD
jgi:hypothetical protein